MRNRVTTLSLAAALCLGPLAHAQQQPGAVPADQAALAQSLMDSGVEEHLRAVTAAVPGAVTLKTLRGRLAPAGVLSFTIDADPGQYVIAAVCDATCGDLDLRMLGPDGKVAMVNEGPDKFPVTEANITQKVSFTVEVVMKSCSKDPCAWGARILRKPQVAAATPARR